LNIKKIGVADRFFNVIRQGGWPRLEAFEP